VHTQRREESPQPRLFRDPLMAQIADRLERLPFSALHRRLLVMGGLGYTFDAMDAAVIAFVLPALIAQWGLTSVQTGVVASGTYIGYLIGAFLAGTLGDLIGRRAVMMWALALYCVASVGSGLMTSWAPFFALRIVAGMGTGAESAIVAPFLAELVASRYRGAFTGALAGFFSFGFVAAALLGYFLIPSSTNGWRIVIFITASPIVMLLWWRRRLPESPRWLASRGRLAEADATMTQMEREIERNTRAPLPAPVSTPAIPSVAGTFGANVAALWSPPLARITLMAWILWASITFSYYSFFTWIPTLLVKGGLTVTKSFAYSIAIYVAQIPGYYSAAWCNERIGRRGTIVLYLILGVVAALFLAAARSDMQIIISGICLSFFMNGTYAGVYAYTPEVYPTEVRATGCGIASSVGRIGAIAAPLLVGYLYPRAGFAGVFGTTTAVLLVGAIAVLVLGVPTRGRSLEAITASEFGNRAEAVS
jgi:putative MFS transporter